MNVSIDLMPEEYRPDWRQFWAKVSPQNKKWLLEILDKLLPQERRQLLEAMIITFRHLKNLI